MIDSMATGAFSAKLLWNSKCDTACDSNSCRPVSPRAFHGCPVRFPSVSCDPNFLGRLHCSDGAVVRRVDNSIEQSGEFSAFRACRQWRSSHADGFGKGRRVVRRDRGLWFSERAILKETHFQEHGFERVCGGVEAEFSSLRVRSPWSLFQPRKGRGVRRRGVRRAAGHVIQSAQHGVHSSDVDYSPKGFHKSRRNGDRLGHGRGTLDAVGTDAETSSSGSQVHCQVEAVSWRERHIGASVRIEATQDRVWEVLTDYGRLAEFIPNLTRSEQIPCPHPGRKWLLQEGKQTAMYWQIEAKVVLDLEELIDAKDGKELRFSMVDGDFKRYVGRWYLRPDVRSGTTTLHYEVNVTPRLLFPGAFVEKIIKSDLPVNLRAIANRAEDFSNTLRGTSFVRSNEGLSALVAWKERTKLGDKLFSWGTIGSACKLGKHCVVDEVHLRRFDDMLENGVHRRVVAAITVEAPVQNVWAVLTDYEHLHEFIPNLATCEVMTRERNKVRLVQEGCKCLLYMVLHARVVLDIWEKPRFEIIFQQVEGDFDSFQGKWTLEPLGAQHTLLKYLVDTRMHKDSLLAEALVEEVIYEDLPANLCSIRDRAERLDSSTLQESGNGRNGREDTDNQELRNLKELSITPGSIPVEEASKGDDKPEASSSRRASPRVRKRPLVAGLQRDFRILERELLKFIAEQGTLGVMPLRGELREAGRVDLEKAIGRNGGFSPVASKLNLTLAYKERKPRGYWDNLENLHKEILVFQEEDGKDGKHMPTRRALERAGRYDLARSLEKWGGLREVARVLGLQVKKQPKTRTGKTGSPPAPSLKASDENEGDIKVPLKTALPLKSTKWVTMRRGAVLDSSDS